MALMLVKSQVIIRGTPEGARAMAEESRHF